MNKIKIIAILVTIISLATFSYAAEPAKAKSVVKLTAKQKADLEQCLDICDDDDICINNCKNALGLGSGGAGGEEECE